MREQPDGTSRILAWIPGNATDVEGLHKCVEQWCLVRHGDVSGWVARRHLADLSVESSQMFQAKGVELWGSVDVLDYPNEHAKVSAKSRPTRPASCPSAAATMNGAMCATWASPAGSADRI